MYVCLLVRTSVHAKAIYFQQCPTPRTQFLPYPPPANYVPGPGCPPANEGTQPTEFNPPPGVYGGYNPNSGGAGSATGTGAASSGGFVTRMLCGSSKCWYYWMLAWVIMLGRLA